MNIGSRGVLAVVAAVAVVAFVIAGMGSRTATRLSIDPARLNDAQTIRLALPPTAGSIQIESETDGALEPDDGASVLTVVDGVLVVPAASCSIGCQVDLRVSTPDPLELVIRYDEDDSEYVGDIEVDYGP